MEGGTVKVMPFGGLPSALPPMCLFMDWSCVFGLVTQESMACWHLSAFGFWKPSPMSPSLHSWQLTARISQLGLGGVVGVGVQALRRRAARAARVRSGWLTLPQASPPCEPHLMSVFLVYREPGRTRESSTHERLRVSLLLPAWHFADASNGAEEWGLQRSGAG